MLPAGGAAVRCESKVCVKCVMFGFCFCLFQGQLLLCCQLHLMAKLRGGQSKRGEGGVGACTYTNTCMYATYRACVRSSA